MAIDNFRRVDFTLDKANGYIPSDQFAKENDNNGRELTVQITDGGVIKDQSSLVLTLAWKHDTTGNEGQTLFTRLNGGQGIFTVAYDNAMMIPGTATACIQIADGSRLTNTRNFKLRIEDNPLNIDKAVAEDSFTVFVDALAGLTKYDGRISALEVGKADKTEVDKLAATVSDVAANKVDKGGTGQVSWDMIAQDARQHISGDKVAVVGVGSVSSINMTQQAVSADKTTFMQTGKNLFNKKSPDIVYNKFINYANGNIQDNTDYFISQFFAKRDGKLTINTGGKAVHMTFFDSNLTYVSGLYMPTTFSYPENAAFMRFSANKDLSDSIQLELGSTSTDYEDYTEYFTQGTTDNLIKNNHVVVSTPNINLFDNSKITRGKFPNYLSGNLQNNPDYYASDYIRVSSNADYYMQTTANGLHLCYFDINKNYVSGLTGPAAKQANKTPNNVQFVRFGAPLTSLNELMFFKGTHETDYEKYGEHIDEDTLLPKANSRLAKLEAENIATQLSTLLPSTIYAVAGEQVSIYYYNALNQAIYFSKGNYSIRFQKKNGDKYEKFGTGLDYMYYFSTTANITLTAKIFDDDNNTELYNQDIAVKVVAKSASAGKNVFWIGDSYTDGFGMAQNAHDILVGWGKTVNFTGTRKSGSETVNHDATGGASVHNYFNPTIGSETNPFYNTSTKTFDFKYYMTNHFAGKKADVFVIALGINDITRYETADSINISMGQIKKIIDSVHANDSSTKILVRTINPQAYNNVRWENSYESNFMRVGRMKYMQEHWNKAILSNFDSTMANVHVIADGAALDTRYGLNTETVEPVKYLPDHSETVTKDTHPNAVGSKQLGDAIACAIANML